ncbi:MAG: hypothetical protein CM15mP129_00640 [Chloroflexota bacterium]|nr:MAG: hypothetical protein CM15mP129_00640 [Chloroflexota bacterium]
MEICLLFIPPISSNKKYSPTKLGEIPSLGKKEAMLALDSACNAFDNGKGIWPTMKVFRQNQSYGKLCS